MRLAGMMGLLLLGGQLWAEEVRTVAVPLIADARFIPGATLPVVPGARPGYTVLVQGVDGRPLEGDAYRITLRFRRDGAEYEKVQIALREGQAFTGSVFYVEGVVMQATATPIYWDTFKVGPARP